MKRAPRRPFRTHHTALVTSIRADVPAFELAPTHGQRDHRERQYIVPVSMMVGVLFH